jgi:hypothetical protein
MSKKVRVFPADFDLRVRKGGKRYNGVIYKADPEKTEPEIV